MSKICLRCEESERFPRKVSFVYKGLSFNCFGSGFECDECVKVMCIDNFERLGKKIVELKDGKIKIDWKVYDRECWRKNNDIEVMKEVLLSLGILSYTAVGNWEVRDFSMSLNPTRGLSKIYFTRKEDVIDFACNFYSNTFYDWNIFRIAEVLFQKDVLKKCSEKR